MSEEHSPWYIVGPAVAAVAVVAAGFAVVFRSSLAAVQSAIGARDIVAMIASVPLWERLLLPAVGGLAAGLFSFGGLSIGLLCAIGGLAIGSLAIGGGAVGGTAIGGGAAGYYYACGGGALGGHVVDAIRSDPQAVEFFRQHGLSALCGSAAPRVRPRGKAEAR